MGVQCKAGGKIGMKMGLSSQEGAVLHGLLEEAAGDMVIKLNAHGFIERGSDSLISLGLDLDQMLFPPHVAEIADSQYSGLVSRHFAATMRNECQSRWIEFRVKTCGVDSGCAHDDCGRWFALSLRSLTDADGQPSGALGLLRSIERVRNLEDELFASTLTDPLTGLVNRHVFLARLRDELRKGSDSALALLSVDRMRALAMQYGQSAADEINWGFAKFLQAMVPPDCELAQIDAERFAVILPRMSPSSARAWSEDLLETFSSLALPASGKSPRLSASAGLARIENSVDDAMRQAELALVMARAGGGGRLAQCGHPFAPGFRDSKVQGDVQDDALGVRPQPR